ncbi:MAG: YgiQ family radical SAM protein [Candidatus Omnitrophota bacterium]
MKFLPVNRKEMRERGWQELDIIFVTADAYCDHPSFGVALLSRFLEREGYRVGIIAQPDWRRKDDFLKLGRPKLFFGVTAGNLDSMLSIYTSFMNLRKIDKYSPGGVVGLRPKMPTIVYTNRIKEVFSDCPIIIGGLEASLRRLAYYDFWSDKVRRSILFDSKADMLIYGMAERQILEVASRLKAGEKVTSLNDVRGTVIARSDISFLKNYALLPDFAQVATDKQSFIEAFNLYSAQINPFKARAIVQKTDDRFCIQLPPALPLTQAQMDNIYDSAFCRKSHPMYEKFGGVPAMKTIETSITSHRGCCGSCSFCSLAFHQGRFIQSRSISSIVKEAKLIARQPEFNGVISDVGAATANMYGVHCLLDEGCLKQNCLFPEICPNLKQEFGKQVQMLKALRLVDGVKQVYIQSGIRYDLLLCPGADEYVEQLCRYHVSGQLKVAPEHACGDVLRLMRKPVFAKYKQFVEIFSGLSKKVRKELFLIPYFITAHPGCGLKSARKLAAFVNKMGFKPEQIQDFIPLPMTRSNCMYYTGSDPETGKPLYVAKNKSDRMKQRTLIQGPNAKSYNRLRKNGC